MNERYFDLNIEKILDGWEPRHAIRELIANALDEQILSGTTDVRIDQDGAGDCHIRDFGRGLRYDHLTQNENAEKLGQANRVIGKFGVGLKDALATLDRRGITVRIVSRHGEISLKSAPKHGFSDVVTLHATVVPASNPTFVGTEVVLRGVATGELEAAKQFFLKFAGEPVIAETPYGQILQRASGRKARIYVTGLLVAEEENFMFSYNITSLTAAMRKALNRERTNVGRTAYTDRVKAMLLSSNSDAVARALATEIGAVEHGTQHDEVLWADVATHACQILNAQKNVVFVTAGELTQARDTVDRVICEGFQVVTVPDNIRRAISGTADVTGNLVRDLGVVQQEYAKSFEYRFVARESLNTAERLIFDEWKRITTLGGGLPSIVKEVRISETIRPDPINGERAAGVWEPATGRIIIRRSELATLSRFGGTLLHEMTHARTGYSDVSREFEFGLTEMLGRVVESHLRSTTSR